MDYVVVTSAMALAAVPNVVARLMRCGAVAHLLAGGLGLLWLAAVGLYAMVYLQLGGRSAAWLVPVMLGVVAVGAAVAWPGLRARLKSSGCSIRRAEGEEVWSVGAEGRCAVFGAVKPRITPGHWKPPG